MAKKLIHPCCILLIVFTSIYSCKSVSHKENAETKCLNIRYINLNIIFDYMVNNDPDAKNVRKRKDKLLNDIDKIRKSMEKGDSGKRAVLITRLEENYSRLTSLTRDEKYFKGKILREIDETLEALAMKLEIDYILNIGEGVVYAGKRYDITEDVLRKISSRQIRSKPISR